VLLDFLGSDNLSAHRKNPGNHTITKPFYYSTSTFICVFITDD
jgi:hypothetical protein